MRLEFLEPDPGQITPSMVQAMLALVGARIDLETMTAWTRTELIVAFDWGSREHLVASDNRIKRRPKPWFITVAQEHGDPAEVPIRERLLQILASHPDGTTTQVLASELIDDQGDAAKVFLGVVRTWLDRLEKDGRVREWSPGQWVALPYPMEPEEATKHEH